MNFLVMITGKITREIDREICKQLELMIYEQTWGPECMIIWNSTIHKINNINGANFPFVYIDNEL